VQPSAAGSRAGLPIRRVGLAMLPRGLFLLAVVALDLLLLLLLAWKSRRCYSPVPTR